MNPSDVHARLVAAVQQRLDVAGSATSGPWNNDDPMSSDGVYAPAVDGYVADCRYEQMGPFAVHNATHIAANDPATVIRHCARDMAVLERHVAEKAESEAAGLCAYGWHEPWPCQDVTDLAAAYAVEVDRG